MSSHCYFWGFKTLFWATSPLHIVVIRDSVPSYLASSPRYIVFHYGRPARMRTKEGNLYASDDKKARSRETLIKASIANIGHFSRK
jgi:hypothetical protein